LKKVKKPDKVEKIPPNKKCDCGKSLKFAKVIEIIKRQLFDIIISPLVVTEYQGEVKLCDCGKYHFPTFPDHVNKAVQYGPVIKSIGSYLKHYGFLSYDRLSAAADFQFCIKGVLSAAADFQFCIKGVLSAVADYQLYI
jgi:hypothetical protein